ncbi:hypothetical protein DVH24_000050 [Malus domestica]|uniref:Uncharacterized protein n=1 Tax=Malus domestica TaxID=3750 RepID=A0A498J4Q4_MALDO|nr:hypothetical protein DVH24_000050 [Malus domestica]
MLFSMGFTGRYLCLNYQVSLIPVALTMSANFTKPSMDSSKLLVHGFTAFTTTKRPYSVNDIVISGNDSRLVQNFINALGWGSDITNFVLLCCDKLSAIFMAANLSFHAPTRHIELDYLFVHQKMVLGSHLVYFIPC